jgi:hypothetical protein
MRAQRVFRPQFRSSSKHNVQRDLYRELAGRVGVAPSVFMLPGRAPDHEIDCIQTNMPDAAITAFDRDPEAVHAAARAGVARAIRGELRNIDTRTAPEYLGHEQFDVVNVDLCANIPGTNRWHPHTVWCDSILNKAARRARRFFVTFVASGHDEFQYLQRPLNEVQWFKARERDALDELNPNTALRVRAVWSQIWEHGLTPVRVYAYRGRSLLMLAMVFARDRTRWTPFAIHPPINKQRRNDNAL